MKDIKIVIEAVKGRMKSLQNITIYVQDNQIMVGAFIIHQISTIENSRVAYTITTLSPDHDKKFYWSKFHSFSIVALPKQMSKTVCIYD